MAKKPRPTDKGGGIRAGAEEGQANRLEAKSVKCKFSLVRGHKTLVRNFQGKAPGVLELAGQGLAI